MNPLQPSDERLNALIDGELTPSDAEPLLEQLRTDAALRERVSQFQLGKELLRHAYARPAPHGSELPRPLPTARARRWPALAGAAVLAALMGTVLGWSAREQLPGRLDVVLADAGHAVATSTDTATATQRIVLHLGSAEPGRALAVLERAEGLLDAARAAGQDVRVEIVANGGGLDLLREGVSAHALRIAALRSAHPQLALVACGQTAQRLRDGGVPVRLLPGTIEASSALDEIVLRLQQGWSYVRI